MPSDDAIEATARIIAKDEFSYNCAEAERDQNYLRSVAAEALTTAYAIDGDFNAGVEAAKATVVRYRASVVNLAGEYDDKIITAVKDGVVGVLDQMISDLENLKR